MFEFRPGRPAPSPFFLMVRLILQLRANIQPRIDLGHCSLLVILTPPAPVLHIQIFHSLMLRSSKDGDTKKRLAGTNKEHGVVWWFVLSRIPNKNREKYAKNRLARDDLLVSRSRCATGGHYKPFDFYFPFRIFFFTNLLSGFWAFPFLPFSFFLEIPNSNDHHGKDKKPHRKERRNLSRCVLACPRRHPPM